MTKKFVAWQLEGINLDDDVQRRKAAENIFTQLKAFIEKNKAEEKDTK